MTAVIGGERAARAWLSRVAEPGDAQLHRALLAVGAQELVARVREGAAAAADRATRARHAAADDAARSDTSPRRDGGRLLIPGDPDWPEHATMPLHRATDAGAGDLAPPWALWVRGSGGLAELCDRAVSVVGARAATRYGEHVAAEVAFGLAERMWTVVSGGAYGIDATAHRACLAAGGTTVAFLAGGFESPYPRGHARLFEQIAISGLLVSEWAPEASPQRHRFLVRNRLIAGLTAGTVVIEAAARSGTATTARQARALGRAVMAVPGPVTSALSVGTHKLLRDGARLVTRADEVIEEIGSLGADLAEIPRADPTDRDRLEVAQARVLDGLPSRGAASADEIAAVSGMPAREVIRILPALEVAGFIQSGEGRWRLARTTR